VTESDSESQHRHPGKVLRSRQKRPRLAGCCAVLRSLLKLVGRIRGRVAGTDTESLLPELVAVFCLPVLLWASIIMALNHEYSATETAAQQSASNLVRAFQESMRRTIGEIDQILLSARAFYMAQGERFDFNEWARNQILPDRMTAAIGMADRTGHVFADTLPIPPNVSIADRPHFRAQIDPGYDDLFISRPVHGRVSNQDTIQFTRKLLGRNGQFAGVTVLSLGCNQLSRFYQTLDLGGGFVSLLSANGVVLARGPLVPGAIGSNIKGNPALASVLSRRSGVVSFHEKSGDINEIASFRRLEEYPLIVMVGLDANTVFQQYRLLRRRLILGGAAATVAIGLIGIFWIKQKRRSMASRRALAVTLETITQGILMLDAHGNVPVINPRALDLLGLPQEISPDARKRAGQRALELTGSDRATQGRMVSIANREADSCFEAVRDDGAIIEVRSHALADGGSVHTYTDVTQQRLADARVRYLAHFDTLTGLANRVQLRQRIPEFVDRPADARASTAFMMIDLDGFKGVNDTLGHDAGDQLLIIVARRLQQLVREVDFVSRLGGDEFVIVRPGLHQPGEAATFARRVLQRLAEPVEVAGQQVRIGASIGIAFHPADGQDCDALLKHADIALYNAKASGRGSFRCFDEQMIQAVNEHHMLESDLRRALDNGELEVHFQPEFSGDSVQITGFEALARWRHPVRGYISPQIFIRVAEQCGLINRLGNWVLHQACAAAADWQIPQRVAVNVSLMQLREPTLPDEVAAILARTGLPAELLEIEVTESVMADENRCVLDTLHALKGMGIGITLDDFGTGYSSLSYLRRFPFDKIKIDKSFVQGQANDQGMRVILEAILAMCHNLGLAVVGEGVETRQQLSMLQHRGCTEVQGYLLGRPMAAELVEHFLMEKARPLGPTGGSIAIREELLLAS
jgi:diguanylate cyclase (GGDEF)-like protein